jgi:hypothetical protein
LQTAPTIQVQREIAMAKGQKRSNRELKKPKKNKTPAAISASSAPAKGMLAPSGPAQKKR